MNESVRQQERYLHLVRLMRRKRQRIIMERQGGLCLYCAQSLVGCFTFDHKIPRSKGGRGGDNLVGACRPCNQAKGDLSAAEFLERLAGV